jgi:integrase
MATIRKLPSGSWQVQVRRKGEPTLSKTFLTKSIADQWARSIESQIDHGVFVDRSEAESTTLGELIDRYLSEITPLKKGIKQETYRLQSLKKRLGHLIIASIKSKHIASYRDTRLSEGVSGTTVLHDLSYLSQVFKVAIQDWGIPLSSNPALLVRKPSKAKGRNRRIDKGELARLLFSLSETIEVKTIVELAIETGMRRSELLSIEWNNVDLENRFILLPDTKNGDSRAVPLSTRAMMILEGHNNYPSGKVFLTRPDSVSQAFNRACKRAGLENLRFHDLRHEATSRLFEKGLNTMEVSAITGHKTLGMLKRYTHLKASDLALKLG